MRNLRDEPAKAPEIGIEKTVGLELLLNYFISGRQFSAILAQPERVWQFLIYIYGYEYLAELIYGNFVIL